MSTATLQQWKGFNVTASGVGDGVTFYECALDFTATNGQLVHMEQVMVAKWKNGKIVHERYYYDRGKRASEGQNRPLSAAGAKCARET